MQPSSLAIIAVIAISDIETKYVVKLDLHLSLVHYYWALQYSNETLIRNYSTSCCQNFSLRFNVNVYVMFPSCNHLVISYIENMQ